MFYVLENYVIALYRNVHISQSGGVIFQDMSICINISVRITKSRNTS
jgi:hypothetical protein